MSHLSVSLVLQDSLSKQHSLSRMQFFQGTRQVLKCFGCLVVDITLQHFITDGHLPHSTCAPATDRDQMVLTLSRKRVVSHGCGALLKASRWPSHSTSLCKRCSSSSGNSNSSIRRSRQPVNDHTCAHEVFSPSRHSFAAKKIGKLGRGRSTQPCRVCMACSQM